MVERLGVRVRSCDICRATPAPLFLPTSTPGVPIIACEVCADAIRRRDVELLVTRQLENLGLPAQWTPSLRIRAAGIIEVTTGAVYDRASAPPPPSEHEGDLDAYIASWTSTWARTPPFMVAEIDGRATRLRERFRSWGIDVDGPAIRRVLWGFLAVLHEDGIGEEVGIPLSAVLSSMESAPSAEDLPPLD